MEPGDVSSDMHNFEHDPDWQSIFASHGCLNKDEHLKSLYDAELASYVADHQNQPTRLFRTEVSLGASAEGHLQMVPGESLPSPRDPLKKISLWGHQTITFESQWPLETTSSRCRLPDETESMWRSLKLRRQHSPLDAFIYEFKFPDAFLKACNLGERASGFLPSLPTLMADAYASAFPSSYPRVCVPATLIHPPALTKRWIRRPPHRVASDLFVRWSTFELRQGFQLIWKVQRPYAIT
jgi:hypothetical protein